MTFAIAISKDDEDRWLQLADIGSFEEETLAPEYFYFRIEDADDLASAVRIAKILRARKLAFNG